MTFVPSFLRGVTMLDFSYETEAHEKGYRVVCGVDEAGRGPLAGPVFAAAVILPETIHTKFSTIPKSCRRKNVI